MSDIDVDIDSAAEQQAEDKPPAPNNRSEDEGRRWRAELKASMKAQDGWIERGKKIEKTYKDERAASTGDRRGRRLNILYANVETLRPAVYMTPPKALATRRQMDRDPVARLAAQLLERSINASCELYDLDHCMDQMVRDWLLPGRGQAWVRYEGEFAPLPSPAPQNAAQPPSPLGAEAMYGGAAGGGMGDASPVPPAMMEQPAPEPAPAEQLTYEKVIADYVPWSDFCHSAGSRTWAEVTWVGRRLLFTKRRGRERFGEPFDNVPMNWKRGGKDKADSDGRLMQAEVFEVWDKESGDVLFIAPDATDEFAILDRTPAPIRFREFFPCPRPLLATTTSESLIPSPDYAQYQDQAQELNTLTARIDSLQKALKVAGLYNASSKSIASLLSADEGEMIAVEDWPQQAEDGGVSSLVEWYPVQHIITVLRELYTQRDLAKANLYEISGIGDIMRGVTDPNETAAAQQIKQRWSGTRLRKRQKDVQRVAKEIFNLKAEVIAEVFQFDTILELASADAEMIGKYLPAGQDARVFLGQVEKMLKSDAARSFNIKVAPDSTLEPDEQAEQSSRSQALGAVSGMLREGAPLVQQGPEGAKLLGELVQFGLRGFKGADSLEERILAATDALAQQAAARQQNPPPNPELEKLKLETQKVTEQGKADAEERALKREQLEQQKVENERAYRLKLMELRIRARELDAQEDEAALEQLEADVGAEVMGESAPAAPRKVGGSPGFAALAQALESVGLAMQQMAQAQNAPRAIVRDQNGVAIGVAPVTNSTNGAMQ